MNVFFLHSTVESSTWFTFEMMEGTGRNGEERVETGSSEATPIPLGNSGTTFLYRVYSDCLDVVTVPKKHETSTNIPSPSGGCYVS